MGGTSKQTQQTQSTQNQTMASSGETKPWEQAMPGLLGLLDHTTGLIQNSQPNAAQNNAISGLSNLGGNPYAPQINKLAGDLLGGGTDRTGMVQGNLDELRGGLKPYTTMDTNPYSNEAFTKAVGYMSDDIGNRIKSQYAGAGYSPTGVGDYGKSLGEGIARGVAPTWLQASNDMEARKLGAINGMYGAGNTTAGLLGDFDQAALGNRVSGAGVADLANKDRESEFRRTLEAEAMRMGIPLQALAGISSLIVPMAQLGGTTTANSTGTNIGNSSTQGTNQMSGAAQFATIAGGLGSLFGGGRRA